MPTVLVSHCLTVYCVDVPDYHVLLCTVCPDQCGELGGQNRCYGPPAVCCPVYENKVCAEMCSTNRTASATTNFTCGKHHLRKFSLWAFTVIGA